MATQLVKLRHVPADELEELYALLEDNGIDFYETGAGNWGISMPALWLRDDAQLERARSLLKQYEKERYARVRDEYEALKAAGKARTFLDIARENPLRYIVYLALIAGLVYISVVPFVSPLFR